jgi:hypothetical protein
MGMGPAFINYALGSVLYGLTAWGTCISSNMTCFYPSIFLPCFVIDWGGVLCYNYQLWGLLVLTTWEMTMWRKSEEVESFGLNLFKLHSLFCLCVNLVSALSLQFSHKSLHTITLKALSTTFLFGNPPRSHFPKSSFPKCFVMETHSSKMDRLYGDLFLDPPPPDRLEANTVLEPYLHEFESRDNLGKDRSPGPLSKPSTDLLHVVADLEDVNRNVLSFRLEKSEEWKRAWTRRVNRTACRTHRDNTWSWETRLSH